jgi:hypothetical protein
MISGLNIERPELRMHVQSHTALLAPALQFYNSIALTRWGALVERKAAGFSKYCGKRHWLEIHIQAMTLRQIHERRMTKYAHGETSEK